MRFLISGCILFAAFFISSPLHSQNNNEPVNSAKIIDEASELYAKGKYRQAFEVFNKVPVGDTNYMDALYNMAMSLYQDSSLTESKQRIEEGIKMFPQKNNDWYNLLANTYDKMGQSQQAITYYDKIIQNYYHQYLAWYNKGITYYNLKQMDEAKKCFQQSLLINSYYSPAHYFLGVIAQKEGSLVPAMLSYVTCLVVNPENKYRDYAIAALSIIAKVTDDVAKSAAEKKQSSNDDFEMIQEILLSKIALDKQYKIATDLDDPIVRQVQVMLEKISYSKSDKGFWMQYYVPFYQDIYKSGKLEPLVYHMLSGIENKSVQAFVKKNKKKIDETISVINTYYLDIKQTQQLSLDDRKSAAVKVLYSNGNAIGKGKTNGEGEDVKLVGPWEFYYPTGQLKSKGVLNDKQEKTGEWVFYHANGKLKERSNFKENKAEGKSISYYNNGKINSEDNFKNGENDGTYSENYYNGMARKSEHYVAGKKHGPVKGFTSHGTLDYTANYTDDKEDGVVTYYHKNGKTASVSSYKNGEANGVFKSYYTDGTLKLEGSFIADKRTGAWKDYYNNNGALKSIANYTAGEMDGEYKEYYEDGKPMVNAMYSKDKIEGKYENFDSDGKVFSESIYEKGRLRELKFFDKEGKVTSNTTTRNGAGNLVFYDAQGNKTSEGYFTKEGLRSGKTNYYYRNGKISSTGTYKDGLLVGEYMSYYRNGTIASKVFYKDDKENGYKITYHENGKIKSEGFVADDENQGTLTEYDEFGTVSTRAFYVDGEIEGIYQYYHPNGKPEMELSYTSGWLIGVKEYDTVGKVLQLMDFPEGNINYTVNTYSGKPNVYGSYKNNYLDGDRKFLFADGTPELIQHYKYGTIDSITKKYYYGGKPEYEGNYKMGEKDGKWTYYYENGALYYFETFNNGRLNGTTKTYNDDGSLESEITYKENNLDGPFKMYGDNGQLSLVLNYDDSKLISYTYEGKDGKLLPAIPVKNGTAMVTGYYRNGAKSVEMNFDEDEVNGNYKTYYATGKINIEGSRVLGYNNGVKKVYYSSGQIKKEQNYYYGNLHGAVKKYYENGKLQADENWYNGDQHADSKYYDNTGKLIQTRNYYYDTMQSVSKN